MSFNPNISDSSTSNNTTYRQRKAPNLTRPVSEKQPGSKLYQKYRKNYENEKKETDKLKKLLATQASDMKKMETQNSILQG